MDVDGESKKLLGLGQKHLVMGNIPAAVNAFQEAASLLWVVECFVYFVGLSFSLAILMWLIEERLSFLPYIYCCIYNATKKSMIYLKLTQVLDNTVVGVQFRKLLW